MIGRTVPALLVPAIAAPSFSHGQTSGSVLPDCDEGFAPLTLMNE